VVWLAAELWDADAWLELGTRQVRAAREAGALAVLPVALHTLASRHLLAGDLARAETLLAEADSILAATGDAPMTHARLRLAALRGADAQTPIAASIREATQRGDEVLVRHAEEAAATLYAGLGRHDTKSSRPARRRRRQAISRPSHLQGRAVNRRSGGKRLRARRQPVA
jgi:hypothetical protein